MEVLQYLGKLKDGHEVVVTNGKLTPYVIVTNYNPDTMSWASAYGYYTTISEMARDIVRLEANAAKENMIQDLVDFANAYDRICENYNILADADKDFEDAFSEEYPFNKSFDQLSPNYWAYMLGYYLKGSRKVGETRLDSNGKWCKPEED